MWHRWVEGAEGTQRHTTAAVCDRPGGVGEPVTKLPKTVTTINPLQLKLENLHRIVTEKVTDVASPPPRSRQGGV